MHENNMRDLFKMIYFHSNELESSLFYHLSRGILGHSSYQEAHYFECSVKCLVIFNAFCDGIEQILLRQRQKLLEIVIYALRLKVTLVKYIENMC